MDLSRHIRRYWRLFFGSFVLIVGSSTGAYAATLHVANNGVDSSTCGSAAHPCRTINQAITRASASDQILVGPGHYGNPEENSPPGCGCLIQVNKQVTITSREGASTTVLDAGAQPIEVVTITADGVIFGKMNKGFTLVNGVIGVSIAAGITGVDVTGNNSTSNKYGFFVRGTGHDIVGNIAVGNGALGFWIFDSGHQLTANVAINNDEGFRIEVSAGPGIHLSGNAAIGNRNAGITVQEGATGVTLNKGNMFGNGGVLRNWGLVNYSVNPVDATRNFWGAATGPGANPADEIYDATDSVTKTPFATKEFKVTAP